MRLKEDDDFEKHKNALEYVSFLEKLNILSAGEEW